MIYLSVWEMSCYLQITLRWQQTDNIHRSRLDRRFRHRLDSRLQEEFPTEGSEIITLTRGLIFTTVRGVGIQLSGEHMQVGNDIHKLQ